MTARLVATCGALLSGLAMAAGAFGAHALRARLSPADLATFETGARYQMYHGLALLAAAWLIAQNLAPARSAALAMLIGIVIFSGSLYLLVLTGQRWFGAITPIGGVICLVGWALIARAAWRLSV
jgi:uncharacterized membrane protein YgdD (TMEM256/DUF423 family)